MLMKKSLLGIAVSLMFLFAGIGIGLASPGGDSRMGMGGFGGGGGSYGGGGYGTYGSEYCGGPGSGTGMPYICEGETKIFENFIVKSIGVYGAGLGANMTISKPNTAGAASHTIFGLGPWWFWNNNGVNLPAVGDEVTVDAKEIDISGTKRIVAMSITVYDVNGVKATLQLRDPETCYPNWAGGWSR
jgi:hypothetical protein